MVLHRLEGLSDREAAVRFAFDVRWRYAAGTADAVAGEKTASFAHTVLVDLRTRLRASADPDRIFTDPAASLGQIAPARSTAWFFGSHVGFSSRSDPGSAPTAVTPLLSRERNGAFLI
jgi:Transposase domain (DUF772)